MIIDKMTIENEIRTMANRKNEYYSFYVPEFIVVLFPKFIFSEYITSL